MPPVKLWETENPAYICWEDEQLKEAGIDKRRLNKLVRMLGECSIIMRQLGLHLYGAAGSGHLIHTSRPTHDDNCNADQGSPVASVGMGFDGGDW